MIFEQYSADNGSPFTVDCMPGVVSGTWDITAKFPSMQLAPGGIKFPYIFYGIRAYTPIQISCSLQAVLPRGAYDPNTYNDVYMSDVFGIGVECCDSETARTAPAIASYAYCQSQYGMNDPSIDYVSQPTLGKFSGTYDNGAAPSTLPNVDRFQTGTTPTETPVNVSLKVYPRLQDNQQKIAVNGGAYVPIKSIDISGTVLRSRLVGILASSNNPLQIDVLPVHPFCSLQGFTATPLGASPVTGYDTLDDSGTYSAKYAGAGSYTSTSVVGASTGVDTIHSLLSKYAIALINFHSINATTSSVFYRIEVSADRSTWSTQFESDVYTSANSGRCIAYRFIPTARYARVKLVIAGGNPTVVASAAIVTSVVTPGVDGDAPTFTDIAGAVLSPGVTAQSVATTTVTGSAINCGVADPYESLRALVYVQSASSSPTGSVTISECDTPTGTYTDITTVSLGTLVAGDLHSIDVQRSKWYIKISLTTVGTAYLAASTIRS